MSERLWYVGDGKVSVTCDNIGSYTIEDGASRVVALVKCNRLDPEDNARGLRIAELIAWALNNPEGPVCPDCERMGNKTLIVCAKHCGEYL